MQNSDIQNYNRNNPIPFQVQQAAEQGTQNPNPVPPSNVETDLQSLYEGSKVWEDLINKGMAEDKDFIAQHSYLRHRPWKEKIANTDFSLFALLNADAFVGSTKMGYNTLSALDFYINFYENLLKKKDTDECRDLQPHLHHIESLLPKLKSAKYYFQKGINITVQGKGCSEERRSKLIDDYAAELADEFAKGTLDLFHSGWQDTTAHGHALYLHLDKANGSLSFINSGSGLKYHPALTEFFKDEATGKFKTKHKQILTIKDIGRDKIGSKDFFKFLLEIQIAPCWTGQKRPNADVLYKGLLKYVEGKEEKIDVVKDKHLYKTEQRSGSCTLKSIGSTTYYQMCGLFNSSEREPEKAIQSCKKIKYLAERETLLTQCTELFDKFTPEKVKNGTYTNFEDSVGQILEDSMQNMGREAESLYEKKKLSSKELVHLHSTFLDIRQRLKEIYNKKSELFAQSNLTKLEFTTENVETHLGKVEINSINAPRETDMDHYNSDYISPIQKFSLDFVNKEIVSFAPEKSAEILKDWLATFNPYYSFKYDHNLNDLKYDANKFFEKILTQLPIPQNSLESFWNKIPQDQIMSSMQSIRQLMFLLNSFNYRHNGTTITLQYAFLAIMDQLARRLPETHLNSNDIITSGIFSEISSPDFTLPNPAVQAQLKKIVHYFDSEYSFHEKVLPRCGNIIFDFSTGMTENIGFRFVAQNCSAHPYFVYMSKFINWDNPQFRAKMESLKISPSDSLLIQLKGMLSETPTIPEPVRLLQDAVLFSVLMERGCGGAAFRNISKFKSSENLPHFKFDPFIRELENSFLKLDEHPCSLYKTKNMNLLKARKDEYVYSGDINEKTEVFKSYETKGNKQNALVHQIRQNHLGEDHLDTALQYVDSYDEANRAVSYAHSNLSQLTNEAIKDLTFLHLLRPERLFSQLKDKPEFADQIITFIKDGISYHTKSANYETSLFLIDLGHHLKNFVSYCGIKTTQAFPDFGRIILDEFIPFLTDKKEIEKSAELILSWYSSKRELDENELSIITEASFFYPFATRGGYEGRSKGYYTISIQKLWANSIQTFLQKNVTHRNKILNKILSLNTKNDETGEWQGTYPQYSKGKFKIDFVRGLVYENGSPIITLPELISDHPDFKMLNLEGITYVVRERDHYTVFPHNIKIYEDYHGKIKIEKLIDGRKYFFATKFPYEKFPTLFDKETKFWMYDWHSHIIAYTKEGKSYRISIEFTGRDNQVTSIEDDNRVFVPFANLSFDLRLTLLRSFVKTEQIECWRTKGKNKRANEVDTINLTTLNLHFNVRRTKKYIRAYCQEFPGYFISEQASHPAFGPQQSFIILQNSAGEKKIIVPKLRLQNEFAEEQIPPHNTIFYSNFDQDPKTKKFYEYSLQNDQLHSNITENQLYLISLTCAQRKYSLATDLITKINGTSALTKAELTVIKDTLSLLKSDYHPAARRLYLQLFSLVDENNLKFPRPKIDKKVDPDSGVCYWDELYDVYRDYFLKQGNDFEGSLSEWEERRILIYIKKNSKERRQEDHKRDINRILKFIQQRLNDLKLRSSLKKPAIEERERNEREFRHEPTHCVVKFTRVLPPELLEYQDVYDLFNKYDPNHSINIRNRSSLLCQNENELRENFVYYYNIAKSGSAEDKKQLKLILDFNAGNITDKIAYYEQLCRVFDNPSIYPTLEEIKKALDEAKNKKTLGVQAATPAGVAVHVADAGSASMVQLPIILKVCYVDKKKEEDKKKPVVEKPKGFFSRITDRYYQPEREKWGEKKVELSQSTPIVFDCNALNKIDQTFNAFFQNLADKFFTFEDRAVEPTAPPLAVDHADPLVREKLKQENADLKEFDQLRSKTERIYSLGSNFTVQTFREAVTKEEKRWDTILKTQQQALLWQANRIPADRDHDKLKSIKQKSYQKRVTWDDLKRAFLKGDLESFKAKTELNEKEVQNLFNGFGDYCLKKCRLDQMKHILKALDTYEKCGKEIEKKRKKIEKIRNAHAQRNWLTSFFMTVHLDENSKKQIQAVEEEIASLKNHTNHFLQHLVEAIKLTPAFVPSGERKAEMLFQLANGFFYRDEQIKKLDEILETHKNQPEVLAQMRTGFGKTKAKMPTYNIKLGGKGDLVVNVWPASIEEVNTNDVKAQHQKSWANKVDAIKFDRSVHTSRVSLKKQYDDILLDIKEGRPLNVRSESERSLEAHLIFLLNLAKEKGPQQNRVKAQLEILLKKLAIDRTKGTAIIDEARHNLDPRDKLIYTLGKAESIPENEVDLTETIFDILAEPPYEAIFDFANNNQNRVSEGQFNQVCHDLAKLFEKRLEIDPEHSKDYYKFVLGDYAEPPYWFNLHPKKRDIALLRGQILHVLYSCCKGNVDRNFGRSKKHEEIEFAIPYICTDTPKETSRAPSECKNQHEALNKTYITYLYKGLSQKQVIKLIEFLQALALKQTNANVSYEKTKAFELFKEICPKATKPLNAMKQGDMIGLVPSLLKSKKAILFYVRNIVAPQIKTYPKTITSTTQNLRSQFAKSISITATPQDTGAHGPDTFYIPVKGTSGQVRHVLYTKCKEQQSIQEICAKTNEALRQKALDLSVKDPQIRATIDIGAINKGVPNKQWAAEICKKLRDSKSPISAVVFFDNSSGKDQFMLMDVTTEYIQPLEGCNIKPSERFTVYDEYRAYGSDIPQDHFAKSLILLSKGNTFTKMAQGYGRMNRTSKTNLQQSPLFAFPSHLKNEIFKDKEPNFDDLNVYLVANETEEITNFNKDSLIDQMDNELRRAILDKILGIGIGKVHSKENREKEASKITVDVEKAIKLFSFFEKELISTSSYDPCEMYANSTKEESTVAFLGRRLETCKLAVQNCVGLTKDEQAYVNQRLDRYVARWTEGDKKMLLPPTVKAASAALGISNEVYHEVETNTEMETEIDQMAQSQGNNCRVAVEWKQDLDLFKAGWEKPDLIVPTRTEKFFALVDKIKRLALMFFYIEVTVYSNKLFLALGIGLRVISLISNPELFFMITVWVISNILKKVTEGKFEESTRLWEQKIKQEKIKYIGMTNYLQEVLETDLSKEAKPVAKLYSKNFLVSDNFYRRNIFNHVESIQEAFTTEQKPLYQVLAIQDSVEGKKQLQFMAIDQNDSKFFRKKLQQDQETKNEEVAKRSRKIAVVDVITGKIVSEGKNRFEKNELESQTEFNEMMTQAKLFQGEIHYSKDQEKVLSNAVSQVGKAPLKHYFEKVVLPHHTKNRASYKNSPISTLLNKV